MTTRKAPFAQDGYIFRDPGYAFALGQLAGKVEGLTNEVAESNKRSAGADKGFDDRLTRLEKRGWVQQGVLIAVSVAGSAVTQFVIYRFASGGTFP